MLPNQMHWSIATNAYSSIFLLIITLLCWKNNLRNLAIFFVLAFALSTSRSVIPGLFLFFSMLYFICQKRNLFLKLRNGDYGTSFVGFWYIGLRPHLLKVVAVNALLLLAIGTMILSGNSNSTPFKLNYSNFFDEGWLYIMSPTMTQLNFEMNTSSFLKPNYWWHIFWLFVLTFTLLYSRSLTYLRKIKVLLCNSKQSTLIILLSTFLIIVSFYVLVIKPYKFQIFIFYFIIPSLYAIVLAPNKIRYLTITFIVTSLFQIAFFESSISIPNFFIIEWVVLFGFLYQYSFNKLLNLRVFSFFILVFYLITQPLSPQGIFKFSEFDSTTHTLPYNKTRFEYYHDLKLTPFCFSNSDIDAALSAANGNRVTFASKKSDRYSMSKPFAIPTMDDLIYIEQLCK